MHFSFCSTLLVSLTTLAIARPIVIQPRQDEATLQEEINEISQKYNEISEIISTETKAVADAWADSRLGFDTS